MMRRAFVIALASTAPVFLYGQGFSTLREVVQYASQKPEYVPIKNNDWLRPDYAEYYAQETPTAVARFMTQGLRFLKLKKRPAWEVSDAIRLLKALTQDREQRGLVGDFVEKYTPVTGAQYMMWGDLFGAFHSLVRCLAKLHELGVIDEAFKLKQPQHFLVFNGNLIDRSPYNLETLTLVMRLMERNPQRVFYVRGEHETREYWHNFDLKQELQARAGHLSKEKIPFNTLINRFFKTLPQALYLRGENSVGTQAFVRISPVEMPLLDTQGLFTFLSRKEDGVFQISSAGRAEKKVNSVEIKAVMKSVDRLIRYERMDGLQLLMPDKGATAWNVFSAPTSTYQKATEFFFDAFVILSISSPRIAHWMLTLYNQDVRTLGGFKKAEYDLLTGRLNDSKKVLVQGQKEPVVGPQPDRGDEIVVGSINDMSKGSAAAGYRLREGLTLRINQANRENEIPGKRIKVVFLDDEYTPHIALRRAYELLEHYKTDIVLQTLGTPTHEALLPLIKEGKILVLFNFGGASIFRAPELKYNIHYRTSYAHEAHAFIDYAIQQLHAKKIAIIYQDDSYGYALRDGARERLKKYGVGKWLEASYPRNTLDITEAAKSILEFDPEVILCFGTRGPYIALVEKLGVSYFAGKTFMGPTFITDVFRTYLRGKGLDLIIARIVPDPLGDTEIAKEYRQAREKYAPDSPITIDAFEAYVNASLFVEALKHIQGPVTKEKLMHFFQGLKEYNFKGLKLSYDPATQELTHYKDVWIDPGKKWIYVPGKTEADFTTTVTAAR